MLFAHGTERGTRPAVGRLKPGALLVRCSKSDFGLETQYWSRYDNLPGIHRH